MKKSPIVIVSSYPPRLCGIATFAEEAREFIQKANPDREVLIISHLDGEGPGVFPLIDLQRWDWWKVVAQKIQKLKPYVVHLQHEYGLYEYYDEDRIGDFNDGFLDLLTAISNFPLVVEPHTIHGRLRDSEAHFIKKLCERSDLVFFKCHYQKWRLEWTFPGYGWKVPRNIMIIPHGARSDRRWKIDEISTLRTELGLEQVGLSNHIVGMVGWIQSNKRWDILLNMWSGIAEEIKQKSGQKWDLLAAGMVRDPHHYADYERWKLEMLDLEKKGVARYYEFIPRGDVYYKVMAVCDFIVLPSIDETQSGTLARIIALNKPYITTAPMEGLTAQTLESEGGLLFSTRELLRQKVIQLALDEPLRMKLGNNLAQYLDKVVAWEVVAKQYNQSYQMANRAKKSGAPVVLDFEF